MLRRTRVPAGPFLLVLSALLLGAAGAARAQSQSQSFPPGMAYKAGFPELTPLSDASKTTSSQPVWADLGLTGGRKSIVFGTTGRKLYVVNYDGTIPAGWPAVLPGEIGSSPTVADLDGDGVPEIVVGFGGGVSDAATVGGVWAFRRDGSVLWKRASANESGSSFPLGVVSTPAVGDVDGDGHAEVVWGSFDGHIYVVDGATGNNKAGWPIFMRDTIWSSPALYDLDNTGKLEIIIGTDTHADPTANPPGVPPTIAGGRLHVLRWNATEFLGFPKDVDEVIISSPVVGDIDGDEKPEIVVGTGIYYSIVGGANSTKALYAWKCDGSTEPGWPIPLTGRVTGSPVLADLDLDGHLDVIVSDYNAALGQNFVYRIRSTGASASVLWKTAPLAYAGVNINAGQPVVGDILGDGKLEIIVPTNTELCILDSAGAQLTDKGTHTGYSLYAPTATSSAAIDVDNGVLNVAAISGFNFPTPSQATVYAYTTAKSVASPWGTVRRLADHTGAIPGSGACAPVIPPLAGPIQFFTLPPCRVVDTRNPVGAYGGPSFAAGASRAFTLAGQCGVPADATGISLNLTIADATTTGSLTMYPGTGSVPGTNTVSFAPGVNRANNVTMGLTLGVVTVKNRQTTGSVNVIMDVNGYYR
jgi:hypothetical protein